MLLLVGEDDSVGTGWVWVGETVDVKVDGIVGDIVGDMVFVAMGARVMIGEVAVTMVIESAVITSWGKTLFK